jgi:hypothetical protein
LGELPIGATNDRRLTFNRYLAHNGLQVVFREGSAAISEFCAYEPAKRIYLPRRNPLDRHRLSATCPRDLDQDRFSIRLKPLRAPMQCIVKRQYAGFDSLI